MGIFRRAMDLAAMMQNYPAMPPPKGVKSNFDNPKTDGTTLIVVSLIFTILPLFAVLLRLYVRKFVSRQKIWWDDVICVLAILASIVHTTMMIRNLEFGLGKHMWDIRALSMTHDRLVSLTIMDDLVTVAGYFVRISILLLYYRLFEVYTSSKRLVWGGIAMCTVITIPYLGVIITRAVRCTDLLTVQTQPLCATRNVSIPIVVFASLNMLTDIYILMIPILRFRGLNVNKSKKVGLIVIFAAGALACAFAVVRLVWTCVHFSDKDTLRYALWVGLFAILEVNIALTCNCAIFVPAIWKVRKNMLSLTSLRKYGYSKGYSKGSSGKYSSNKYSSDKDSNGSSGRINSDRVSNDAAEKRGDSRDSDKPFNQYNPQNMQLDDSILQRLDQEERSRIV